MNLDNLNNVKKNLQTRKEINLLFRLCRKEYFLLSVFWNFVEKSLKGYVLFRHIFLTKWYAFAERSARTFFSRESLLFPDIFGDCTERKEKKKLKNRSREAKIKMFMKEVEQMMLLDDGNLLMFRENIVWRGYKKWRKRE